MRGKRLSLRLATTLALLAATMLMTVTVATAQQESVVYTFDEFSNSDGFQPEAGLITDASGNLYGTTYEGGRDGYGTIFELTPQSGGGWTETVLHNFANHGGVDGMNPTAGLVFDASGNLYGTTEGGGAYGDGTVFELTPEAGGGWSERIRHSFNNNGADGYGPAAGLVIDASGNLYGTTVLGGPNGFGTVFEINPRANGSWSERVLYSFSTNEGNEPYAGVAIDAAGNLYGTTTMGGSANAGTVFGLIRQTGDQYALRTLHDFGNGSDGSESFASLVFDVSGNLYGTTLNGGKYGSGTVFELSPGKGVRWSEAILHSFNNNGTDGFGPYASVILDSSGNLYGTTYFGGTDSRGIVFKLTRASGTWTETILHSFVNDGADGYRPKAPLVFDASGNLYGTTEYGGTNSSNLGTVFEITP